MRKWQTDRNRRRTKPKPADGQQPQNEPLQPIYPDMKPDNSVAEQMGGEEREDDNIGNRVEAHDAPSPAGAASPREGVQRKRRRRGRGGRGRTDQQQAAADSASSAGPISEVAPELPAAIASTPVPKNKQERPAQTGRPPRGVVVLT